MKLGHLSFAERNRPLRFDKFFGKRDAVAYLVRQIKNDDGRSVLLHGGWGNGKSSLGRVYALGLLCEHDSDDERPCLTNECPSCGSFLEKGEAPNLLVLEHGEMSGGEFSAEIIERTRVEATGNGRFVVMICQADSLS